MTKTAVVALGGNALTQETQEGTQEELPRLEDGVCRQS